MSKPRYDSDADERDAGADNRLDDASVDRLFTPPSREVGTSAPAMSKRRGIAGMITGGLALAATVTVAVMVSRSGPDTAIAPAIEPAPAPSSAATGPITEQRRAAPISFTKPDIKLSPAALTWRDGSNNPFLRDLAPAFEAYRAGEYPRAVAAFGKVSPAYADAIEVLFYLGVSRMLAGDDAGAVAPLEAAARLRNDTFADDVAWFLAVAQQRSGRPDVRNRFAALCDGKSTYAAAACAAVAQIDAAPIAPREP